MTKVLCFQYPLLQKLPFSTVSLDAGADLPTATGYPTLSAFCLRPLWPPGPRSLSGNFQLRPASRAMSGSSQNSGSSLHRVRPGNLVPGAFSNCIWLARTLVIQVILEKGFGLLLIGVH